MTSTTVRAEYRKQRLLSGHHAGTPGQRARWGQNSVACSPPLSPGPWDANAFSWLLQCVLPGGGAFSTTSLQAG